MCVRMQERKSQHRRILVAVSFVVNRTGREDGRRSGSSSRQTHDIVTTFLQNCDEARRGI